jgi:DNA-binding CsgD family transcriptional regulator
MAARWDAQVLGAAFAEAATDPLQWAPALDRLVDAVNATGILVLPVKVEHRLPGLLHTEGVAETTERYTGEGWHKADVRNRGIPYLLERGITVDQDFITPEQVRRSEYYNELLIRQGLRWFAGLGFHAADELWCLSVQRSPAQGPFTTREQRLLLQLRGPLTSAATIAQKLSLARAVGGLDAFEMMDTAALLVDRQGSVVRTNSVADAKLGTGLRVAQRRLVAADPDTSSALARLIGQAVLDPGEGAILLPPLAVPVPERRPLVVYALPLRGMIRDLFGPARAIVVVRDLDERPLPPMVHLSSIFGLTAAEAKLAARLGAGEALETVAEGLGIARETARNQLKAIFQKTGVHRQAELVALLGRFLDRGG